MLVRDEIKFVQDLPVLQCPGSRVEQACSYVHHSCLLPGVWMEFQDKWLGQQGGRAVIEYNIPIATSLLC